MILNDQKDAKELLTKNPKTKILIPPPFSFFVSFSSSSSRKMYIFKILSWDLLN